MKHLLFLFLFACSGTVSAQYFNIFPDILDTSGTEFHYVVSGVEDFTDSLPLILNVELLVNDEQLDLITSRIYDLSDTATFAGLTFDVPNATFTIDLGNHPTGDYLLHMWVAIAGERYDEIHYQQP